MCRIHMSLLAALAVGAAGFLGGCGGSDEPQTTITVKQSDSSSGNGGGAGGDAQSSGSADGAAPEGFGTLTGRVEYPAEFQPLNPIHEKGADIKDAEVCAVQAIPNQRMVVSDDGGVANVFVYLQSAPDGAPDVDGSSLEPAVFDQEGCKFIPHAMTMVTGQTVLVKSNDAINHNTHTNPKRNSAFNTVIKPNDRDGVPFNYSRGEFEPVSVICDYHKWMQAYHLPLDHQFAAVTGENGQFEIPDLPAGEHEFMVWHESASGDHYLHRDYKATIKPDQTTEVTITYPPDRYTANPRPVKSIKLSSLAKGE